MANANRTGSKDDPHMKEYEEISDYIFALAPEFGFSNNFEHDLECDEHGKNTEVNELHNECEDKWMDEISENGIERLGIIETKV